MKRILTVVPVLVMVLHLGAQAQVHIGETALGLSGNLQVGYNDAYTNYVGSTHSIEFGGTADLTGSYYDPNFISFGIEPFYNQSRANSESAAVGSSTGVAANATLFGGSRFPTTFTYSKIFDGTGNYGIPGIAAYDTHGNSQQFGVQWGAHIEGWPSLNVSFTDGSTAYSVFGLDTEGTTHNKLFSTQSSYRAAGFNLTGSYQYVTTQSSIPQIAETEALETDASGGGFSVGATHSLPLHGSFAIGFTRNSFNSSYAGYDFNATVDNLESGVNFAPARNLSVGVNASYTNDLFGSILAPLVGSGTPVTGTAASPSSDALGVNSFANYDIPKWYTHLNVSASHQQQTYLGKSFSNEVFEESVNESRPLLTGYFTGTVGVTQSLTNPSNTSSIGLITMASYNRQIGRWSLSATGNYNQATQTVLIGYTSSGYGFGGNVGYHLGRSSFWQASANVAKSLLTDVPGSANSSQTYSTSLSLSRVSVSGSYSIAKGNSIVTNSGLVPTPLPLGVIPPSLLVFYNGTSYSFGLGAHPFHGFMISGAYAKALSDTLSTQTKSNNNNENAYIYSTYRLRQIQIVAGWSKINQGFSASGTPPTSASEIYFGISRAFNFF